MNLTIEDIKLDWLELSNKYKDFGLKSTYFLADLFDKQVEGTQSVLIGNGLVNSGQIAFINYNTISQLEVQKKFIPCLILDRTSSKLSVLNFIYFPQKEKLEFLQLLAKTWSFQTFQDNHISNSYSSYNIDTNRIFIWLAQHCLPHAVMTLYLSKIENVKILNPTNTIRLSLADTNWILNNSKNLNPKYSEQILENLKHHQSLKEPKERLDMILERLDKTIDELDMPKQKNIGKDEEIKLLKKQLDSIQEKISILKAKKY